MYTIKSKDTRMHEAYDRIADGKPFDEKLMPYTITFLKDMIKYFEEREDFERCQTILRTLEEKDHEKGYTKWRQTI